MTNKILCIYHANCADGLGAAWAVHRALGPDVEFVAAKYGDPHPGAPDFNNYIDRDILIVDFSYPLPVLRAMAKEVRSVLVLDHHKTAREDLSEVPLVPSPSNYQCWLSTFDEKEPLFPNLSALFDMERSGAGIAWDYLSGGNPRRAPRPRIIDLIEDRDLWRFRFGFETRAFHAVLAGYDFGNLPAMLDWLYEANRLHRGDSEGTPFQGWFDLLSDGRAILRANVRAVANAVASSRRTIKIAGHVVPCANVPGSMASDAGHLLCGDAEIVAGLDFSGALPFHSPLFSVTYYDGADGRRHFSLRSPGGGADVGQIARHMAEKLNEEAAKEITEKYGTSFFSGFSGGGHEHAAGFDAPIGWLGE